MRFPWSRDVAPPQPPEAPPAPKRPQRLVGVNLDSGELYGVRSYDWRDVEGLRNATLPRDIALGVPAYLRAHEDISSGLGQLPLQLLDPSNSPRSDWLWLTTQPTPGEAKSITWTRVVEDLIDYDACWLLELPGTYGRGPRYQRLDAESVTVRPDIITTAYGTYTTWPETPGLIRIDSPTPSLLKYGARALMTLARLEEAVRLMADGTPPIDWFETTDDFAMSDEPGSAEDPDDPDLSEIEAFLNDWRAARRKRSTGYIPPGLVYKTSGFNPEQLQLGPAREQAVLEIARLTGVDAEDLSVSTTSRTYFNAGDRQRRMARFVLGPYLRAIEDRLSMDDVTPPGYRVAFDLTDFLKADDVAAAQVDKTLIEAGVMTPNEVRDRRGLQPIPGGDQPRALAAVDAGDDVVDGEVIDESTTPPMKEISR